MWAIVPIKHFEHAKARLAPALTPAQRRDLMRAMASDVLESLAATAGIERILVISGEPEVEFLARAVGATVVADDGAGLNAAVTKGARIAAEAGARGVLIVHGDLPLAHADAFTAILDAHGDAPAVTVVPDAREEGSNCLACSPPDVIAFHFGRDSCRAHLAAAREQAIEPVKLRIPSLALDVDSPQDLESLLATGHGGRSVALLRSSGIASRVTRETTREPATVQVTGKLGGSA